MCTIVIIIILPLLQNPKNSGHKDRNKKSDAWTAYNILNHDKNDVTTMSFSLNIVPNTKMQTVMFLQPEQFFPHY